MKTKLSCHVVPTVKQLEALYGDSTDQRPNIQTLHEGIKKLPEPPVRMVDIDCQALPEISHGEMLATLNAYDVYQLAKADFEAKRAALRLKLLQHCHPEDCDFFAELAEDGTVIIIDSQSEGEPVRNRLG